MQLISLYKLLIRKMQQKWVSIGYLSVCIYKYHVCIIYFIYICVSLCFLSPLSVHMFIYLYIYTYLLTARDRGRETTRDKNIFDSVIHNRWRLLCHTWLGLNTPRFGRSVPLSYSKVPGRFCRKITHWYKQKTTLNPSAANTNHVFGGI